MGCCGQRRAAFKSGAAPAGSRVGPPVRLRLIRGEGSTYRGAATGAGYAFSPSQPVQTVHPADAQILLRTGLFSIVPT